MRVKNLIATLSELDENINLDIDIKHTFEDFEIKNTEYSFHLTARIQCDSYKKSEVEYIFVCSTSKNDGTEENRTTTYLDSYKKLMNVYEAKRIEILNSFSDEEKLNLV